MKRGLRELGVRMGVTFTASTRHTNKQKHIFSCGNTVTHHYTTCACRCGVAALFFFCPRHCRFGFVAALPLWFCCGIAAVFAALPLGFCCGLAALVLLGQLCSYKGSSTSFLCVRFWRSWRLCTRRSNLYLQVARMPLASPFLNRKERFRNQRRSTRRSSRPRQRQTCTRDSGTNEAASTWKAAGTS